jgi:hypothetical protein
MMVAGTFGSVDGRPRPNLLRLNADGTVDAGFAPPADIGLEDAQTISSIAVDPEGRVFVVGRFRRFNGRDAGSSGVYLFRTEQFFSLFRLKADGTPDAAFAPLGDNAFLQMAPEMLMVDPWVGWPWPVAGGGMLEVFPQSDGKLLAYGYLGLWQRWDIRPGPHFLARIYDGPPATSVELATARLVAGPGAEQATVTVRRLGDSIGPATVNYTTRDGSAMAGRDYGAASGTLSFAPLEVVKSFTVPLLDPGPHRQDREFSVTLSDATGVEGISGPATQLVLVAPFGFQRIIGPPDNPRLTIYGSVGSTYLLEAITSLENAWSARAWSTAAAAVTLTNELQTIHDPWQDATTPARLYRLRHLAP